MTLADVDWRLLRGSLVGLGICVLVSVGVLVASYQFSDSKQTALRVERSKLLGIRGRYQSIDEEERLIEEFLPRYLTLEERGVIGDEHRLDWIETLRSALQELKLPERRYALDTQTAYRADFMLPEGPFQVYVSRMTLDLGLLHEGDLPALLARIDADVRGLFRVSSCSLARVGTALVVDPTKANLRASCTLEWLTVRQPDLEQPA